MFKFILVAALIACVVAEDHHEDHHAETKLWKTEIGHDGWLSEFETTNHIRQLAHGDKHGNIAGEFEWVDPHGEHVAIKYVADEHGYQPEGEVIPKIPDYILKSIEYNKAHPHEEEEHHHDDHHHQDDHHHH